jgi:hypothetical protein
VKPKLPRCIAWVKRRTWYGGHSDAHRCNFQAHAQILTGVQVCGIHAGVKERHRKKHHPDQIRLFEP